MPKSDHLNQTQAAIIPSPVHHPIHRTPTSTLVSPYSCISRLPALFYPSFHLSTIRSPIHPCHAPRTADVFSSPRTGGSSSASATTVSRGLLPLTLGCDGGGSIRIPSTYCGIYGLKPTHSRVGRSPATSIASSTSVIGPMARCMADLELGYRAMAAPDIEGKGASAMFAPPGPMSEVKGSGVGTKRALGICRQWFDCADPPVLNLCHAALSQFESSGDYEIIEIDLPLLHEGE